MMGKANRATMQDIFNRFGKEYVAHGARDGVKISVKGKPVELYKITDGDFKGYGRKFVTDSGEHRIVQVGRFNGFIGDTRFFVKVFDDKGNNLVETGMGVHLSGDEFPYVDYCNPDKVEIMKQSLRIVTGQSFVVLKPSADKCVPPLEP